MSQDLENIVFSSSISEKEIAKIIVDEFKKSDKLKDIKIAEKYFSGHNKIEEKERVYYDKDRNKIENPAASNVKLKAWFNRILIQQKQDYALGKTFVLKVADDKEKEVDLANDIYGKLWKDFADKFLYKTSYSLAGDAIKNGIAWLYIWIDENDNFCIKKIRSSLVYPLWSDSEHEDLDRLV